MSVAAQTISTANTRVPAPRPTLPPPLSPEHSRVFVQRPPAPPVSPEIRTIVHEPIYIVKPVVVLPEQPKSALPPVQQKPVQNAPENTAQSATKPPEKTPKTIAGFIALPPQTRNKPTADDAIKPAIKNTPIRHTKALPVLKGKAGRVHTDDMVDDILKTMLRDGKASFGKARQQYNYRKHVRLADVANDLVQQGVPLHAKFKGKDFWNEWSLATGIPLQASFYRKFA